MCCTNGKVTLSSLAEPPESHLTYVAGATRGLAHFHKHIRKYNSCFQITSFEATNKIMKY